MRYAVFDYAILRNGFAHVDNVVPVIKTITWLLLSRLQGNKPHRNSPEPSEPCLRNLHQHAPELSGTLRNLPRPTGTNLSEPSGTHLRNLRQHHRNPPKSSGTFRELASGTYTILHRNSPEPSQICLRNLHQHTPEPSGTFRNPPPEPRARSESVTRIGHQANRIENQESETTKRESDTTKRESDTTEIESETAKFESVASVSLYLCLSSRPIQPESATGL